jgi:hypothetical protein
MKIHTLFMIPVFCLGAVSGVQAGDFDDEGRVISVAPRVRQLTA